MPPVTPIMFDPVYGVLEAEICNAALGHIGAEVILDTTEDTKQSRACRSIYAGTRDELLRIYPFNFATKITYIPQDLAYAHPLDEYQFAYKAEDHRLLVCTGATGAHVITVASGVPVDSRVMGRAIYGTGIPVNTRVIGFDTVAGTITIDRNLTANITAASLFIPMIKILEVGHNDNNIFEAVGGGSERRILCNIVSGAEAEAPFANILEVKYVERVINPDEFDSMFQHALEIRLAGKLAIPLAKSLQMKQMLDQEFSSIFQAAKISSSEERQLDEVEPDWSNRQQQSTVNRK